MNNQIAAIWESEAKMEEAYHDLLHLTKFDRTKDASKLVAKLMESVVNPHPTFYDVREWVVQNIDDFNVASQILLNAQRGSVRFKVTELMASVQQAEKQFEFVSVMNPFAKGMKFIESPETDEQKRFNNLLAQIRNLKILSTTTVALNSFRLSPLGSTPALADMNNLSSISILGLREFIGDDTKILLLNHEAIRQEIELRQQDDGGYQARGLVFSIYSKSGGDTLLRAITSRWLTHQILSNNHLTTYVVPKYDSLLTVGHDLPAHLQEFVVEFKG